MNKLILTIFAILFSINCSSLKQIVHLTGGIFGKIKFPLPDSVFLMQKESLLEDVKIMIKGKTVKVTIDENGYFWFLNIPTGIYNIEYYHNNYKENELLNVKVCQNKLTMIICDFAPKNSSTKFDFIKDWENTNMACIQMYDVKKRGKVKIDLAKGFTKACVIKVVVPEDKSINYQYKNTIWYTNIIEEDIILDNIIPGKYDIYVNFLGYNPRVYVGVIIKQNLTAILEKVSPSISNEPTFNRTKWLPQYK